MNMLRKLMCLALTAALLAGVLTGCGSETEDTPEEKYIFTAAVCAPLETLDPAFVTDAGGESVLSALFEGLMRVRDDGAGNAAVGCGMAKEYIEETNYDGTVTYTFTLRSAARWSDGTRVKAEDFVYAWQRLVDPATASPNADILSMVAGYDEVRESGDVSLLGVKAKGESTFIVTLAAPCAYFISSVCTASATVPLRSVFVEDSADWAQSTALVTNGPYQLESWSRGTQLTTRRNAEYYESKLVAPDALCFRFVTDEAQRRALILAGELDYAANTAADADESAAPLVGAVPLAATQCVIYNHLTDTFSVEAIRQAFDLTIDREKLTAIIGAECVRASGCVPYGVSDVPDAEGDFRTMGGDLCEVGEDDATLAGKLMTSTGHYQGAGIPTLRLVYVEGEPAHAAASALRILWKSALGVTVEPVGMSEEEYAAALAAGDFDLALTTLTARRDDALAYLAPFGGDAADNYGGYHNETYDLLIGVAESTNDPNARTAFLHDAEEMLLEDAAVSPLCFAGTTYLLREGFTGVAHDARGHVYFFSAAPTEEAP